MSRGIMSAFEELHNRMRDRACNRGKYDKEVCTAWSKLYQALGGVLTGDWSVSYVLPNATHCVGLIVAARIMDETFKPFPHGKIYVNGKDGEFTPEYKEYMAQPHGALQALWEEAADACEESVA